MNLSQAYQKGKIDRFEIMALAELVSKLNNDSLYASFEEVDFTEDGQFVVSQTKHIKKKEVLQYFSLLLAAIYAVTNRRLASIFLNHYLACQNNTEFYKYLPKSRRKPFLMACGGFSGSGKSRIAREIAPFMPSPFGAIIIRDDIVRKQIAGVDFSVNLDETYYTPEYERLVYKEMRRQAKQALMVGYPVILDALFYNPKERNKARELAETLNVAFEGLWAEAPLIVRSSRVKERKNNPSDVKTPAALLEQLNQDIGSVDWRYVYTSGTKEETLEKVKVLLKKYLR